MRKRWVCKDYTWWIEMWGRSRETWWSKIAHQGICMRKSERHLVEEKGSWFTVKIKRREKWDILKPIVVSIPILCNNLYRIMGCSFSSIKVSMVWPNHIKTLYTLCVIVLFYVFPLIYLHQSFHWHNNKY